MCSSEWVNVMKSGWSAMSWLHPECWKGMFGLNSCPLHSSCPHPVERKRERERTTSYNLAGFTGTNNYLSSTFYGTFCILQSRYLKRNVILVTANHGIVGVLPKKKKKDNNRMYSFFCECFNMEAKKKKITVFSVLSYTRKEKTFKQNKKMCISYSLVLIWKKTNKTFSTFLQKKKKKKEI